MCRHCSNKLFQRSKLFYKYEVEGQEFAIFFSNSLEHFFSVWTVNDGPGNRPLGKILQGLWIIKGFFLLEIIEGPHWMYFNLIWFILWFENLLTDFLTFQILPWKIMMKISGWNLEVLYFLRLTRKVLTYFAMLMFLYPRYVICS